MPEMLKYVLAGGPGTEQLLRYRAANPTKKNSVAFSPQANYTDWRPPLVDEI
jgi:hypothetical protein